MGPRDKGDLCVLFNEGVRIPQDPQSFGVCVKGRMLYTRSFWGQRLFLVQPESGPRTFSAMESNIAMASADSNTGSSQNHGEWGGTVTSVVRSKT